MANHDVVECQQRLGLRLKESIFNNELPAQKQKLPAVTRLQDGVDSIWNEDFQQLPRRLNSTSLPSLLEYKVDSLIDEVGLLLYPGRRARAASSSYFVLEDDQAEELLHNRQALIVDAREENFGGRYPTNLFSFVLKHKEVIRYWLRELIVIELNRRLGDIHTTTEHKVDPEADSRPNQAIEEGTENILSFSENRPELADKMWYRAMQHDRMAPIERPMAVTPSQRRVSRADTSPLFVTPASTPFPTPGPSHIVNQHFFLGAAHGMVNESPPTGVPSNTELRREGVFTPFRDPDVPGTPSDDPSQLPEDHTMSTITDVNAPGVLRTPSAQPPQFETLNRPEVDQTAPTADAVSVSIPISRILQRQEDRPTLSIVNAHSISSPWPPPASVARSERLSGPSTNRTVKAINSGLAKMNRGRPTISEHTDIIDLTQDEDDDNDDPQPRPIDRIELEAGQKRPETPTARAMTNDSHGGDVVTPERMIFKEEVKEEVNGEVPDLTLPSFVDNDAAGILEETSSHAASTTGQETLDNPTGTPSSTLLDNIVTESTTALRPDDGTATPKGKGKRAASFVYEDLSDRAPKVAKTSDVVDNLASTEADAVMQRPKVGEDMHVIAMPRPAQEHQRPNEAEVVQPDDYSLSGDDLQSTPEPESASDVQSRFQLGAPETDPRTSLAAALPLVPFIAPYLPASQPSSSPSLSADPDVFEGIETSLVFEDVKYPDIIDLTGCETVTELIDRIASHQSAYEEFEDKIIAAVKVDVNGEGLCKINVKARDRDLSVRKLRNDVSRLRRQDGELRLELLAQWAKKGMKD